jgi:malonate transporter
MIHALAVTVPIFALIGLGLLARLANLVTDDTGRGLSDFVFAIAIPALIVKTLSAAALPAEQPWGYWLSYFIGVAIAWSLAMLAAGRFFGLKGTPAVVAGFAAGQSNTVLVGIPLILEAYGDQGAVPLFLLIAVHLPVTMSVATVLAEGRRTHWLRIAAALAKSPVLLGIAVGVLIRVTGLPMPAAAQTVIDSLAAAAVPCALFAMGVSLRRFGLAANLPLSLVLSALKLLVHPAAVYVLAMHVLAVPPVWAGVAVLFAASPCGINSYLFAERFKAGVSVASGAIAISTALSVLSTALWLRILGIAG